MRAPRARPYLLLLVTIFFWGTAFRWTDVGAEHASAVVFSALRAIPAAIALLALAVVLRSRRPRGRTLVFALLSGPLMVTLAFEGIAEELRRQYSIGYIPREDGKPGQRKQIKVRVNRPNLVLRARDSYIVGAK